MIRLNNNQPPEELSQIYRDDYYWYLHTPQYREAFLRPLGDRIDRLCQPVLDVACGEGWLSEFVTVPYTGFDGSAAAIKTAKNRYACRTFLVDRFEDPEEVEGEFGTVVFGNILDVLVHPDSRLDLVDLYRQRFRPSHFVLYELERFDATPLERHFRLVDEYHASVTMDIQEVKKHRKILVFRCD